MTIVNEVMMMKNAIIHKLSMWVTYKNTANKSVAGHTMLEYYYHTLKPILRICQKQDYHHCLSSNRVLRNHYLFHNYFKAILPLFVLVKFALFAPTHMMTQ